MNEEANKVIQDCRYCKGQGFTKETGYPCPDCNGKGYNLVDRETYERNLRAKRENKE